MYRERLLALAKTRVWPEAVATWVIGTVVIGLVIALIAWLSVPSDGPGYCRNAVAAQYPQLAAATHEFRSAWARTMRDHWVSAIVVQPENDLTDKPLTFVCHFASTNYASPRVEAYVGDVLDAFKRSSTSNLSPHTWFLQGRRPVYQPPLRTRAQDSAAAVLLAQTKRCTTPTGEPGMAHPILSWTNEPNAADQRPWILYWGPCEAARRK